MSEIFLPNIIKIC